jgi:ubiquinone/menaquinone biosynthesis C-methylase UbiE
MPNFNAEVPKAVYNKYASAYETTLISPYLRSAYRYYDLCLKEIMPKVASKVVLDFGCGPGIHSIKLARVAKKVIGVDIAENLVLTASEKKRELCLNNVHFVVADGTNLPLPSNSVDCVIAYGSVIGHIAEKYEEAIAEISRVCAKGALINIEFDNKWSGELIYNPMMFLNAVRNPFRGYTRSWGFDNSAIMEFKTFAYSEMKELLAKYQFSIEKTHALNVATSFIPPFQLYDEQIGDKTPPSKVVQFLDKLDLHLANVVPFKFLGITTMTWARKK